jgi:hypothetical protein
MSNNLLTSLPVVGGMFDDSDEQAMAELAKNRALYESIKTPNHVWEDYSPDLYSNETSNYVLQNEDPALRAKSADFLTKMAGLSETGMSDIDAAGYDKAREVGSQMARGGTEAAIADAQRRGVGGSGTEFGMREIANQEGAKRAQEAALAQAADSARQRAMYNTAYGQAVSQSRGDDRAVNSANTNVINDFNTANTNQRNATNNANIGLRNEAQRTNQEGKRGVAQQNFDNEITKVGGVAGSNTAMANGYAAQNAANTANRNQLTQIGTTALLGPAGYLATAKKKPGEA